MITRSIKAGGMVAKRLVQLLFFDLFCYRFNDISAIRKLKHPETFGPLGSVLLI